MERDSLLLAHFAAAREEVLLRIRLRERALFLYAAGFGLLGAYYLQSGEPLTLLLIVIGAVMASVMYTYEDGMITSIGRWFADEYVPALAGPVPLWDAWWPKNLARAGFFQSRYLAVATVVSATSGLAMAFYCAHVGLPVPVAVALIGASILGPGALIHQAFRIRRGLARSLPERRLVPSSPSSDGPAASPFRGQADAPFMAEKSEYSKEAREFISEHIKEHRHEGMPQDQAVAAALDEARRKGMKVPEEK